MKAVYSCITPYGASTGAAVSGFFLSVSVRREWDEHRNRASQEGYAFQLGLDRLAPVRGSYNNRLAVGDPYGRARGHALLWVRSERAQQVAKPEPVTERLAGMCGSVRH